ncbi:MAG TPA: hypothetical protein VNA14_00835 [Mycobacteriales bacterium]|nr:hypothetical protein [Mycobacteriales bacterium]
MTEPTEVTGQTDVTGHGGRHRRTARRPIVPVGGGVPVDAETGERYGYLPRRAARRKLLIRAQLGLPWMVAALGFAAMILVAGTAYLLLRPSRPPSPFVDQGPISRYADGTVTALPDGSGWVDRRAGLTAVGEAVSYCPADGGWVGDGGTRFDSDGARAGGGPGLLRVPVRAAGGRVYVDPTGGSRVAGAAGSMPPCPEPQRPGDPPPPDGL